ncbi:uncharacterized protein V1518DRAFT_211548 [Limtongia smithiae]|uniref:uncharacterized protein n=1 Tax=Limtongia smithiae TaxID=1125753 RepID=UPI0034CD8D66
MLWEASRRVSRQAVEQDCSTSPDPQLFRVQHRGVDRALSGLVQSCSGRRSPCSGTRRRSAGVNGSYASGLAEIGCHGDVCGPLPFWSALHIRTASPCSAGSLLCSHARRSCASCRALLPAHFPLYGSDPEACSYSATAASALSLEFSDPHAAASLLLALRVQKDFIIPVFLPASLFLPICRLLRHLSFHACHRSFSPPPLPVR